MRWTTLLDRDGGQGSSRRSAGAVLLISVACSFALIQVGFSQDATDGNVRKVTLPEGEPSDTSETARLGKTLQIDLPLDDAGVDRARRFAMRVMEKARKDNTAPVLIFEFRVPSGQEEFAGNTEFTAALELAQFLGGRQLGGDELNRARTVAYVPNALPGHAVLVALACDDIMMGPEATLGPVGVPPEEITQVERSAYGDIAQRRKTLRADVALWLLDPSKDVLQIDTGLGVEYVSTSRTDRLEQLRGADAETTIRSETPLSELIDGPPGQFTGTEARQLKFISYLPATRQDVAVAFDLPSEAMDEDPALTGDVEAIRVDLKGPISPQTVDRAIRAIDEGIEQADRDVNFICLWIDSPGGSLVDSSRLAGHLADYREKEKILVVAYVPNEARSDAALIALACDQIVMRPDATLGGSGAGVFSTDEIAQFSTAVRDRTGPWKARPWSLPVAILDSDLAVYRCEAEGKKAYLCDDELAEQRELGDGLEWRKGDQVTRPGRQFLAQGEEAVEFGLATHTVGSFNEFRRLYVLEDDPDMIEPGWATFLIEALASPGVAAILLMIAFVAMYAELHAPGIGVGGFVATVCFLLFFWSHYLGGTAGWLELTLFVAGVTCLLLEVFVLPGFGIFGLGGGCLILASLILASQTFVWPQNPYQFAQMQRSVMTVVASGVGIVASALVLRRWLPQVPVFNKIVLAPPDEDEAEQIAHDEAMIDLESFVPGTRGVATTQLTPSGKARFGDTLIDVITDGDVVIRGAEIEVIETHGNRVIVREIG